MCMRVYVRGSSEDGLCTYIRTCMYSVRIGTESGHGKGIGALRPGLDSAGRGRLVGGYRRVYKVFDTS